MADFVAVIRRAVDGLPDNTPENRERVYAKARSAVRRQLENMSPPPSQEVFRKQLDRLEAAISEVEIEHTEALPAEEDNADEALQYAEAAPAEESRYEEDDEAEMPKSRLFTAPIVEDHGEAPIEAAADEPAADRVRDAETTGFPPASKGNVRVEADAEDAASPFSDEPLVGDVHDEVFGLGAAAGTTRRKRSRKGWQLAAAGIAVLVLVGAAYALWDNRVSVLPMIASLSSSSTSPAPQKTASSGGRPAAAGKAQDEAGRPTAAPLPADTQARQGNAKENASAELPPGGKYTQRLLPDGTESNPGPAPVNEPATQAGGRSVSAQTAEASAAPLAGGQQSNAADQQAVGGNEAGQPAEVAQKMYLYEERYKDQAPTAVTGSVVWSLAKDTSDGSSSTVPVIHGEISVPEKGITALVTIKRNNDPSLPASHLIEVVFALPGKFDGGGIQSVERVSLKQTEQARGDPLIAVPAKITDNFFMIALNDYPQAVKTNLDLLKTRDWIDIPLTYTNGRRALITLQKGASGAEIFDKALAAWAQADNKVTDSNITGAADGSKAPAEGGQAGTAGGSTPSSVPDKPAPQGQ